MKNNVLRTGEIAVDEREDASGRVCWQVVPVISILGELGNSRRQVQRRDVRRVEAKIGT
jgi:hypothetical protein